MDSYCVDPVTQGNIMETTFQYDIVYFLIPNPVPHLVLHKYWTPNQSWNPNPPFPSLQFSSNDHKYS